MRKESCHRLVLVCNVNEQINNRPLDYFKRWKGNRKSWNCGELSCPDNKTSNRERVRLKQTTKES